MLNHFTSFRLIYYFSLCFGVMAVRISKTSPGQHRSSRLTPLLPLVWLLLLLYNDITKILDKDNILNTSEISKNKEQELTIKVIMTFEYWISNCLMIFNLVYGLRQIRAVPNMLTTLWAAEKVISRYLDPARLRQIHQQENFLTRGFVLLSLLVTLCPIALSHAHGVGGVPVGTMDMAQILIKDVSKFIVYSVELQFSVLCVLIYHRMKLVNTLFSQSFLRNVQAKHTLEVPPNRSITHRRFQGHSLEQRSLVDKCRILTLTKQNHEVMFRLAEELRQAYQFQLMCSVGEVFFNIINHVYVTVKMFRPGELSYWGSVVSVMWVGQETARVIVLSLAAGVAADEVNRTLWYASSIDVYSLDLRIRHLVKCFCLHLQHRRIKFTLCQMFTINTTFLAAMAVAIVNSLMLSLQYKYSDKQSLSSTG